MFLPIFLLYSCLIVGLNAQTSTTSSVVRLTQEATCPDATALAAAAAADSASVRQVVGVSDARVCSVACATWNQCAVSRYLASTRTCQLGNQAAWLRLWTPAVTGPSDFAPDCTSLIRPPLPPAPLLSKLLALYNFRFGTDNLASANPGAFPAAYASSLNAVHKTRVGFNLTESFNSYVQVDLGGSPLRTRLRSSRKVTIFAKLTPATDHFYVLFLVQNRSQLSEPKYSVKWSVDIFGAPSFVYFDLSSHKFQSPQTASGVKSSMFSAAVSFDPSGTGVARFYFNGTWLTNSNPSNPDVFAFLGDEVVRIGYDASLKYSGIVHCIAVASDTLEIGELSQIEEVC